MLRVVLTAVLLLLLFWMYSRSISWVCKPLIACKQIDLTHFRSGDLLFFFEHGHQFPWPGHLAIVVQLAKYGQLFVWDMPNILFYGPDLLKPLHKYLQNTMKFRNAKIYIQHLNGPEINVLPQIKFMSASSHFDLSAGVEHANLCLRDVAFFPSMPKFLPRLKKDNLYYCSSAVLTILIKLGVVKSELLDPNKVLSPATFLDPDFDINQYVNEPFFFSDIQQLTK